MVDSKQDETETSHKQNAQQHGWNMEIRAVDQHSEQSNKRNETSFLIVQMFPGREGVQAGERLTLRISLELTDKRVSGETISNEVIGISCSVERNSAPDLCVLTIRRSLQRSDLANRQGHARHHRCPHRFSPSGRF